MEKRQQQQRFRCYREAGLDGEILASVMSSASVRGESADSMWMHAQTQPERLGWINGWILAERAARGSVDRATSQASPCECGGGANSSST